jgi:PAS domain S-box-containing protein
MDTVDRVVARAEKAYAAERGIAAIRVLIIVFNTVAYSLFQDKAGTYPALAYAIIVTANVYGIGVFAFQPYKRFPVMLSSYFTSVLDAGFITIWLFATGGVASPFVALWYVSVTAVAFRYGGRETIFAAALYGLSYVAMVAAAGQLPGNGLVVVTRVAYIGFVSAVGALVAAESTVQYREKVEARALAEQLRESEERVRRLNDAAFEGIVIQADGRVVDCNEAFARMLGAPQKDLIGRSVLDFVAPESRETLAAHVRAPSNDPYEVVAVRSDGTTFPAEVVGRDFPWGGRTVRVAAVRDISERATNRKLKELDRLKTQFINNAAHELATPLTPIKLQSHLLRVGSLGPLNEKQAKAMNVVARNVDHLGLLVKDVLDSARVQGGTLVLRRARTDVVRIVRESAESFHETARGNGVELAVEAPEPPVLVDADDARVTQVLFNLLSNALKFTPEGGRVALRVARAPDGVRVSVTDTGIGVRPEDIPKLFQPFSQLHDTSQTGRGGTGLGLYISRGIVEAHGGRIWAESPGPGRGATVTFVLPAG